MKTPVALIFFNRHDTLEKVFQKVKEARPPKLFLIQDGPRVGNDRDKEQIQKCREVVENIDWDCEVFKNYSEVNLGCGVRPQSGISWVLSQVERAIFLEDDCVPESTFFDYCDCLLEKYKDDERVGYISGLNHFGEWDFGGSSYGFCQGGAIWGWATWRRAWEKYDYSIGCVNDPYMEKLMRQTIWAQRVKVWNETNEMVKAGKRISYWDVQWGFVKLTQNQLVIVPKYNLINNIGVGVESTHAQKGRSKFHYLPVKPLEFPLTHPWHRLCDSRYDQLLAKAVKGNYFRRAVKKLLSCFKAR